MTRTRHTDILVCVCVALVVWLPACRGKPEPHAEPKQPSTALNQPGVTLDQAAQTRGGIRTGPLPAHAVTPELTAFGKLEEDPSASFIVRAPIAGTLQLNGAHNWPALGETIPSGAAIGQIEPRLAPSERISLNTQLAGARSDLNAATASVTASGTALKRASALNADNKNVSDRVVEDAVAKHAAEQSKETAARETVRLLESSLRAGGLEGSRPLIAERGGEVVELLAQPGEAIEQGSPVLRVARLDRLLARIDLPIGDRVPANNASARIVAAGFEDHPPMVATPVGVAATTDPHTQGVSLLYRLTKTLFGLRPGTAITAHVAISGTSRAGVLIPRAAVVQQNGQSWVYVQTGAERFVRREISLDLPAPGGFLAAGGFSPGDKVVVIGAQILLSEEFKSRNNADNE